MRSYKTPSQNLTLADLQFKRVAKRYDTLQTIWQFILPEIKDKLFKIKPIKEEGRKPYSPEYLMKYVFLRILYNLSERNLIEQVLDSRSFSKFVGITSEEEIPSRKTLRRFMHQLKKHGIDKVAFSKILDKLLLRGIKVSKGAIVDSKIIVAQGRKSPSSTRRDKDAKFTKKHEKTYFGYKMHAMVDKRSKIVLSTRFTPANSSDIEQLDYLISQARRKVRRLKSVYGDKAYDSISLTALYLFDKRIKLKAIRRKDTLRRIKRYPHPIRRLCEIPEKRLSSIRARVEHVFGRLVSEFNVLKARFYDIRSNEFFYTMQMVILNVKMGLKLLGV